MRHIIIIAIISLLPLFADEDFLKGVRAEDLMLERIETPAAEDTVGISDWSKYFFNSQNEAISFNGQLRAEVRTEGEFGDGIYVTDLRTKEVKYIDDRCEMPKWAPQGNLLAYLKQKKRVGEYYRGQQLYGGCELWVYDFNEDIKIKVTDNIAVEEFVWSKNGNILVFTYDSMGVKNETPLFLAAVDITSKKITIIDRGSPYTDMAFTVSPDGRMVAYCKPLSWKLMSEWYVTNSEIFIANIDGTGRTKITNTYAVEEMVKWCDDGKTLIVEQVGQDPFNSAFPKYVKIVLKKK
ncbi:MAG: hypothetical protein ABIL44_04710 [candidate division WOR-3 bacterium]